MSSHTLRRFALCALLLAGLGTTAACGGGDDTASGDTEAAASTEGGGGDDASSGSGGTAPDPCTLITNAELETAFGTPFEPGESSETTPPITFHACGFIGAADDLKARSVTIQTLAAGDVDEQMDQTIPQLFEGMRDASTQATPVDGLGDDAYSTPMSVNFIQDGIYVTVDAPGGQSAEAQAGLMATAELISAAL